ncbi:hypothetical protein BZL30_2968 [Mycobacterium kansasii]|uniref:Uncharacterized protein n=1 Tax=Mycobacterium kansasii TaxID=1768 RepID=A0A1V3XGR4_MYCKA|nr:hypothetical protein BZL30_2968 [Mycobacterium kansasii]
MRFLRSCRMAEPPRSTELLRLVVFVCVEQFFGVVHVGAGLAR